MVTNVSSIVLLHNVLMDDKKKFKAFSSNSPFFERLRCVSELLVNSSCNSGDFWLSSENASPRACCCQKCITHE